MEISKNNFEILIVKIVLHDVIFPWYCTQSQLIKMNVKKVYLPTAIGGKVYPKNRKKNRFWSKLSPTYYISIIKLFISII